MGLLHVSIGRGAFLTQYKMLREVTLVFETLATDRTLVRPLLCVNEPVSVEIGFVFKVLPTIWATEWLVHFCEQDCRLAERTLFHVSRQMCTEFDFVGETFTTNGTEVMEDDLMPSKT